MTDLGLMTIAVAIFFGLKAIANAMPSIELKLNVIYQAPASAEID